VTLHDTLTDTRPSWHNPRILALLLLVFLCGLACGVCAARIAFSRRPLHNSAASWKGSGRASTMAHLKQDLNLTPDQAQQIEMLLDDLAKYYDNLQGQMDDFRQDGKQRIMKILTPEQQKKFSRILNEMSTRIHAEPLDPGPPAGKSAPAPAPDPHR
jgi:Spy/CpxP family protein refolding chaperone